MIAVDTNILVHAHRKESKKHSQALAKLGALCEGKDPWGIPMFCIGEFLRVITHPKIFSPPHSIEEATLSIRRVLESPSVSILLPSSDYIELLLDITKSNKISGNLVFDAQIAAICRECGIKTILTEDSDFKKFDFLKIENL